MSATPRDARIALWARLYRLLAERAEYRHPDAAERYDRTDRAAVPSLGRVDAELIARSGELDRLCGAAVRSLRERWNAELADVLAALDPERLAAVALALPEDRRRAPALARALRDVDMEAVAEVDSLADDIDALHRRIDRDVSNALGPEVAYDAERFAAGARRLAVGLPHELTLDDLMTLLEAHRLTAEVRRQARRARLGPES